MLEKEFEYYKKHQEELVAQYDGKFIVIRGDVVNGPYDTELQAYTTAINKLYFEKGSFLIQQCLPGEGSYTQSFHSRVHFIVA
jgi:hypothetical protein